MENIKTEFKEEFERTVAFVEKNYCKDKETAKLIVGTIICNVLKELQIDSDAMLFIDFYRKHIHNAPVFTYEDFTVSQIEEIINETPMCARNKDIAHKLYVEKKTYETIAEECQIFEPRTIGNNKDRISKLLQNTASKIYKN